MGLLIESFFNVSIFLQVAPLLLRGLVYTILLSLIIVPLGLLVGFMVAFCQTHGGTVVRTGLIVLVDLFRSLPPLVLLIFIYYGLPYLGIGLPALAAVCLALVLNASSYYAEIFRAGMESVPAGQREAARSSGLGAFQTSFYIVGPQAVRNVLPDLVGNALEIVKVTSYASVVAIPELVRAAIVGQSMTYNATPLIAAALLYLIVLWPFVRLLANLERKAMGSR